MLKKQRNKKWLTSGLILLSLAIVSLAANAESNKGGDAKVIEEGDTVSIEYTLKLKTGDVIDSNVGSSPLQYVQGAQQIISGLEKALVGMKVGDTKHVMVTPKEGYGDILDEAFVEIDKNKIPEKSRKAGTMLQGKDPSGKTFNARVAEVKDKTVVVDLNHPLAGKTLYFDVKILAIQKSPK
jgi:FKBP-type peptidyl-prolyl cis-trans isomerase SlyD